MLSADTLAETRHVQRRNYSTQTASQRLHLDSTPTSDPSPLVAPVAGIKYNFSTVHLQPYCRFNARVLHRVGLFRWGLHFLLEASEPLPAPVTTAAAAKAAASSSASVTSAESAAGAALSPLSSSDSAGDTEKSCDHLVAIAGFGGVKRPAAAVAAAGLDTRDGFMVSCTLLLQRVLATCTIQRDFDRVIGATLSTLADGGAAGSREARCAGTDPDFAAVEEVLEKAKLLGDEGSAGNKVLSGQAMVRLYLLRMLLEIVTLPVTAASKGEFPAAEGVYVGGVGSPCARRAQAAVEVASLGGRVRESGTESSSIMMGVSQLERWVDGIPPVVDVGADGAGLPSPLYAGRSRLFRTVCMRALRPDWFISLLETCREEVRQSASSFGVSYLSPPPPCAFAPCSWIFLHRPTGCDLEIVNMCAYRGNKSNNGQGEIGHAFLSAGECEHWAATSGRARSCI